MDTNSVLYKNIELDTDSYGINEYITLENAKNSGGTFVRIMFKEPTNGTTYESNPPLFHKALLLAFPTTNLSIFKDRNSKSSTIYDYLYNFTSPLINYYGTKTDDIPIHKGEHIVINTHIIEHIKKCQNIIIEHNKNANNNRGNGTWTATRWQYAYQNYMSSTSASSLDSSILNLITGLESLLVKGEGALSHKVSLNASLIYSEDKEERLKTFKLFKTMYNYRSKIVHGEIEQFAKLFAKPDVYQNFYNLRKIYASLLIKTFNVSEEKIFAELDNIIFESRAVNF